MAARSLCPGLTRAATMAIRQRPCIPTCLRFAVVSLDAVSTITYGCIVPLETTLSLPISEGSDMGEHVGFQTSGPDCGPHRCVRTTTERRARPSAQRVGARDYHPAPVPA